MFGIEIIEVALGLALVYFAVSTICSGIYEAFAQLTDKRSKHLEDGIRKFLNDEATSSNPSGLATALYSNPEIWSRLEGKIGKKDWIEASKFSGVLFDILVPKDEAQESDFVKNLKSEINKTMTDPGIQKTLNRIVGVLETPIVGTLKGILEDYYKDSPLAGQIMEIFQGIDPATQCKDCYDELLGRLRALNLPDGEFAAAKETLDALVREGDKFANVKELIRLRFSNDKIEEAALNLVSKWEESEKIIKFRTRLADRLRDNKIQKTLLAKIDAAEGKIADVRKTMESVFDEAMGDVGKWYRANVRMVILVLSVIITVGFNVDTLELGRELWNDNDLRAATLVTVQQVVEKKSEVWSPKQDPNAVETAPGVEVAEADTSGGQTVSELPEPTPADTSGKSIGEILQEAQVAVDKMETLPVGWNFNGNFWDLNFSKGKTGNKLWASILLKILGFVMTIAAASLGAPFWYNLLKSLTSLKDKIAK
ncbi:MAG: hypothetical protein H6581_15410 [Bacteroidia bacterium]|nr:hypothetical protein [Bacteroidia bacterium]